MVPVAFCTGTASRPDQGEHAIRCTLDNVDPSTKARLRDLACGLPPTVELDGPDVLLEGRRLGSLNRWDHRQVTAWAKGGRIAAVALTPPCGGPVTVDVYRTEVALPEPEPAPNRKPPTIRRADPAKAKARELRRHGMSA